MASWLSDLNRLRFPLPMSVPRTCGCGEDTEVDISSHGEEWVAENQELFDRWVEEAKKAGQ